MENDRMTQRALAPGMAALALHLAAAVVFGLWLDGYSHRTSPLALLGAQGVPRASLFNLCAYVLPGALVAFAMWRLRSALPTDARWPARVGAQSMLLSAVAFAAQGLSPLDPQNAHASANGLHALAWTLWWIACASGAALLAWAAPDRRFRMPAAVLALAVPLLALPPWPGAFAAFAPRAAFVAWLVWAALAPRLSRA